MRNVNYPFPFAIWPEGVRLAKAMPTSFGAKLSDVAIRGARGAISGLTGAISRGKLGRSQVVVKELKGGGQNALDLHKDASALHALRGTGVAPELHGYNHGSGAFGSGRHYVAEDVGATMDGVGTLDQVRSLGSQTHAQVLGNLAHSAFSALGTMHNAGIAHGDLQNKPEHLFFNLNAMGAQDHAQQVASGNHGVKFIDYGNAVHRDDASFPRAPNSPKTFAGTTQEDIRGVAGTLLRAAGSTQDHTGAWVHPQGAGKLHQTLAFLNTSKGGKLNAADIASTMANINAQGKMNTAAPVSAGVPSANPQPAKPRTTYAGRQRLDML